MIEQKMRAQEWVDSLGSDDWGLGLKDFFNMLHGNRERRTEEFYRCQLKQLRMWAEERALSLQGFTAAHFRAYMAFRSSKVSKRTQLHDYNCIKVFFRFCNDEGRTQNNPTSNYKPGTPNKPIIVVPSSVDVTKLLKAVTEKYSVTTNPRIDSMPDRRRKYFRSRDYAVIAVMIATGCRPSEPLGLYMEDIDLTNKAIMFRNTKTHKDRKITFEDSQWNVLLIAISPWLDIRRKIVTDCERDKKNGVEERAENWFFLTETGGRLDTNDFSKRFKSYCLRAGIPKLTRYGIRHRTISDLVSHNPRAAQLVAGHSDISTTIRNYDHMTAATVSAALSASNPLGHVVSKPTPVPQKKRKIV